MSVGTRNSQRVNYYLLNGDTNSDNTSEVNESPQKKQRQDTGKYQNISITQKKKLPRKRRSKVWEHYKQIEVESVVKFNCNYCETSFEK